MRNKNLRISKSIIPLDWNPNDPAGYNEWMKMIVQENLKSNGSAIEKKSTGFEVPEPKFISEIFIDGIKDSLQGMDNVLAEANKILKGGAR
ncbi:hypothetical protein EDC17_101193 [Sphingobacterium alimentarium]|uniref:Uncharacterized protein n=1 Tax=Sphingobacterium alimentarium TaxID=797292 RepID=A0A4R3VZ79_9SPHI|nr:hypothetical protein [Sphingobacterium alimentarium]TCV17174.1 hypothetical protein EDC17_101193 [Sphingobacterium alimentarium]